MTGTARRAVRSARCGSGASPRTRDGGRRRDGVRTLSGTASRSARGYRLGRARSCSRVEGDRELVDQGVDQRCGVLGGRLRQARVDQCRVDRAVTELTLDVLEAQAALEQMGGVGVPEGVRGDGRADAGIAGDELDRALNAARAHRVGGAEALLGAEAGRKQQPGMTMSPPVAAERGERQFGQDDVAVLLALAESDVDSMLLGVDVLDLERESLSQAKAHAVGTKEEGLVAVLASGVEKRRDLGIADDIRQGSNVLRAHDPRALPGLLEGVLEEERQPREIEPHRAPRMRLDEGEEVLVVLLVGNLVGAPIVSGGDTTHRPSVGIAGGVGKVVELERGQVRLILSIETALVFAEHRNESSKPRPGVGRVRKQ